MMVEPTTPDNGNGLQGRENGLEQKGRWIKPLSYAGLIAIFGTIHCVYASDNLDEFFQQALMVSVFAIIGFFAGRDWPRSVTTDQQA